MNSRDQLIGPFDNIGKRVRVKANDYSYTGWLVSVFQKRSKAVRCVVEDRNGRLFIHNPDQLDFV